MFAYFINLWKWITGSRSGNAVGTSRDATVLSSVATEVCHCRRRRRALIVGINYSSLDDKKLRLQGCVNDAERLCCFVHGLATRNVDKVCEQHSEHWQKNDEFACEIRILCDDEPSLEKLQHNYPMIKTTMCEDAPTRKAILKHLKWLVDGADAQTSLWFSYSGHGVRVPDRNHDERDFRDEAIVPLDYGSTGFITDDYLREHVIDALPRGAQLTCLIDACHSATSFDLHISSEDHSRYMASDKRALKKLKHYRRNDWQMVQQRTVYRNNSQSVAKVVMLSGCKDSQTSADALEENEYTGAMTHAFLKHFKRCDDIAQLLQDMNVWLRIHGYDQRPILSYGSVEAEEHKDLHTQLF